MGFDATEVPESSNSSRLGVFKRNMKKKAWSSVVRALFFLHIQTLAQLEANGFI